MDLIPFVALFPEQGEAETRTFTTHGHPELPDDVYALVEAYCMDPTCDCQGVMLHVVAQGRASEGYLASISLGFDRDKPMAGPYLDPMNPQSIYAEPLLELVKKYVLTDEAYMARLQSHYDQVKTAMWKRLSQALRQIVAPPSSRGRERKRSKAAKAAGQEPVEQAPTRIYQLKVTLRGLEPPIWRRFQVYDDTTLRQLHYIIQMSMDWDDDHLHAFVINGETYSDQDPDDWFVDAMSDAYVTLGTLLRKKSKFTYEYDFGDSWQHDIVVEKVIPPEPGVEYPICLEGERAGPPEDCGGVWGYALLLEAIADPEDEKYWENIDTVGEGFDPEKFDVEALNENLKRYAARPKPGV